MLEKQELCKDYMQSLEPCWKLCDASFLALWERESRHFNDESTSNALEGLAQNAGADVVKKAALLAEGNAANREDIVFFKKLPLFTKTDDGYGEIK